jgi:hypothetical protein
VAEGGVRRGWKRERINQRQEAGVRKEAGVRTLDHLAGAMREVRALARKTQNGKPTVGGVRRAPSHATTPHRATAQFLGALGARR